LAEEKVWETMMRKIGRVQESEARA